MSKLLAILCVLVGLFSATEAFAATITVNTTVDEVTADNGSCSLREAIININDGAETYPECVNTASDGYGTNDTIELSGETYCLSLEGGGDDTGVSGDLDIKKVVTISGVGQDSTIIDAGNRPAASGKTSTCSSVLGDRVLQVHRGITDVVTLQNLTITGGLAKTSDGTSSASSTYYYYYYYGAGVYAQSDLTLTSVTIADNTFDIPVDDSASRIYYSGYGGGIYAHSSTLTITSSTISGNSAEYNGGGIYAPYSTLTITSSTISGNSAEDDGGGIVAYSSTLTISDSTVTGNSAEDDGGGGISAFLSTLNIESSAISDNKARYGGGISAYSSTLDITGSTISGNSANVSGGGIYAHSSTLTITSSTISENEADGWGGGIYAGDSTTLDITSSTISENEADGWGGGIVARYSTLDITSSTISDNEAEEKGGGIYAGDSTTLDITSSTISENEAGVSGGGIVARYSTLDITSSTISDNEAEEKGGGISADSTTLTITGSTISGNTAGDWGGGISAYSSTLDITGSTISGNSANVSGGGIDADDSTLNIESSTISGNSADYRGGGISAYSSTLTISDSTISDNEAGEYGGGGIYAYSSTLNISNSTISDNEAGEYGGGISAEYLTTLNISNCTISDNEAGEYGGGISAEYLTTLNISNCTISDNEAGEYGGGGISVYQYVYSDSSTSTLYRATIHLKNSILAGNTAASGNECHEGSVSDSYDDTNGEGFVSYGYNFFAKDGGCSLTEKENAGTDITDKTFDDLKLGHLADNGGVTQTHSLLAGSPAIDAASCTDIDGNLVTTDQRGTARPTTGCDIGAYELDTTKTIDIDGDGYYLELDDCNDSEGSIKPDATEICEDGIDNDCDTNTADDSGVCGPQTTTDIDGDGYYAGMGDCDDTNGSINPDATEICEDGIDNDCDTNTADDSGVCGPTEEDAGMDASTEDAGMDASTEDAGMDASTEDAGMDASTEDGSTTEDSGISGNPSVSGGGGAHCSASIVGGSMGPASWMMSLIFAVSLLGRVRRRQVHHSGSTFRC